MLETDDCGQAADQLVDAFCLSCSFFAFFRFIALAALLARENENDVKYFTLFYSVTEDSPSWRVFVSWPRDLRACYPQRPSAADVCSSQGGRVTPDARETPAKKDGAVLWPSPPLLSLPPRLLLSSLRLFPERSTRLSLFSVAEQSVSGGTLKACDLVLPFYLLSRGFALPVRLVLEGFKSLACARACAQQLALSILRPRSALYDPDHVLVIIFPPSFLLPAHNFLLTYLLSSHISRDCPGATEA
ncbi:hypothetical protein B0H14DRAFT_3466105 [Mycena olivaceomarginata]|nr:hypothetical protein B0H14DRAFT_3466105 [Mycena olivaceomarginata]